MPPDDPDLSGVDQLEPDQAELDLEPEGQEPDEPDSQDGEGEDDQAGDQPDDIAAAGEGVQPPADKPAPRRDRRIQVLADRLRERERQIDELIRQRTAQPAPAQPAGESEAQRAERRSRLTPEERISEDLRDSEKRVSLQLQGVQYQNWESNDRALYETKASIDPLYKRWKDRVEKELTEMRGRGQIGVARDAVLRYLIGSAMLDQRGDRGNRQQRRAAESRVRANTTRAVDTRSNSQSNRRSGGRSLEERLSDIPL